MKVPRNILTLTYWSFPDGLIQSYTLPYLRLIRKHLPEDSLIFLLTLERKTDKQNWDQLSLSLKKEGIRWIPQGYHPFGLVAMVKWFILLIRLFILVKRNRIQVIHCWATPAGAMGYMLSLMTGAELVIDSYEPHAEAMVENGTWKPGSLPYRLLFKLEKLQTRRASHLIAANEGMREYAREKYGVPLTKLFVKPACVDLGMFHPPATKDTALLRKLQLEGKIVAVYAGKLGGIYLDREVFDFFKVAHDRWGGRFGALLLTSHSEEEISSFCRAARLERSIIVTRFVPHHEVPRYLALADFALTPVKPVPTKRYCTPVKDGEYWAMGLPVVITKGISDDSGIIQTEHIGAVLEGFDHASYSAALGTIEALLALPLEDLRNRIRAVAVRHRNYSLAEDVYREIYGR